MPGSSRHDRILQGRRKSAKILLLNNNITERLYHLSYALIDDTQSFSSAAEAGAAFAAANVQHKPRIVFSDGERARVVARTMTYGDELVKSLPFESDPDFVEGFRSVVPGPNHQP